MSFFNNENEKIYTGTVVIQDKEFVLGNIVPFSGANVTPRLEDSTKNKGYYAEVDKDTNEVGIHRVLLNMTYQIGEDGKHYLVKREPSEIDMFMDDVVKSSFRWRHIDNDGKVTKVINVKELFTGLIKMITDDNETKKFTLGNVKVHPKKSNLVIGTLDEDEPGYYARVNEFNEVVIHEVLTNVTVAPDENGELQFVKKGYRPNIPNCLDRVIATGLLAHSNESLEE